MELREVASTMHCAPAIMGAPSVGTQALDGRYPYPEILLDAWTPSQLRSPLDIIVRGDCHASVISLEFIAPRPHAVPKVKSYIIARNRGRDTYVDHIQRLPSEHIVTAEYVSCCFLDPSEPVTPDLHYTTFLVFCVLDLDGHTVQHQIHQETRAIDLVGWCPISGRFLSHEGPSYSIGTGTWLLQTFE